MNRIFKHISFLLLVLITSCNLSDDYSDCPPGYLYVRVAYDWSAVPETVGNVLEEVNNIDLYIFDSSGLLVTSVSDSDPDPANEEYTLEVLLPYGTYDIISWINTEEYPDFTDRVVLLSQTGTGGTQSVLPCLYGVFKELVLTDKSASVDNYLPVTLIPVLTTNTLNLTITGGESGDDYQLSVVDTNGSYYFDNTIAPGEELQYITPLIENGDVRTGSMVVGQLSRERTPRLVVTSLNTDEIVYEASLVALILREETEEEPVDFDQTHVFDLAVDISRRPEDPVRVRIGFSWPAVDESGREGIIPQEAHTVDLFLFDDTGLFIGHIAEQGISLTSSYQIETGLPAGDYHIIAWFNAGNDYCYTPDLTAFQPGTTRLADAYIALAIENGMAQVTSGSPLLYGSVSGKTINNLFAGADGCQHIDLVLTQNTYELTFLLKGELADAQYRLEMYDQQGRYDFQNSFALHQEEIQYTTYALPVGEQKYEGNMTVERLERGRQPRFSVRTISGRVIYENNLVDLILKHETGGGWIDFSKIFRFKLELEFTENNDGSFLVEVTINGWKVKEEEGQLG